MNKNRPPSQSIAEKEVRKDSKQCSTAIEPRKRSNERLHALNILTHLLVEKTSLSQLMPSSAEVSPMTKEICFGFCRHYFRLQAIANCLLQKKPKEIEIWVALLIGIYQLHYMKLPDYAVVKETVALLEKIKRDGQKA